MTETIDNPILNSPYEQPDRYYEMGREGPTGEIKDGRRPSESFIPIALSRKGKAAGEQVEIDFDVTRERREPNSLINRSAGLREGFARCACRGTQKGHRGRPSRRI